MTESIDELQTLIDDVNSRIKKLNGGQPVTNATSMKVETIISKVSRDEQNIGSINSQISTINSKLTQIQNAINNLTTTTNNLSNSDSSLNTKIDGHINNKSNPHKVTQSQIGLGNVRNLSIYTGSFSKKVAAKDFEYYDVNSGIPDRWGRVYVTCNNNTINRTARLATNDVGSFQIFCQNNTNSAVNISGYWLWIG